MTVFRYVVALALCALVLPAAAHAAGPACGATITKSTKLKADLANCPGDGLVIGADRVTLDLGRHTISGQGVGIRLAGHRGVTIQGGRIQGFATGVALDGADGNRLRGVTVSASTGRGVDVLNGSDANVFEWLTSTGNRTGIAITESHRNVVTASTLSDNAFTGVLLFGAEHSRVLKNRVSGNGANGVAVVEGSSGNLVLANAVQGSETGLIIDTSHRNVLALNRVIGGGDGILVAGDANTVAANLVDRSVGGCETCSGYGIGVLSGAGNLVKANAVQRSATDGINVAAPGTTIAFNLAHRNGALGIRAVEGVRDGGGNRASANGDAAQCAGVVCRKR